MTLAKTIAQNSQAYWRQSNLSYLRYLNVSSALLRNLVKEPARSKAAARSGFFYNKAVYGGEKVQVKST